MDVGELKELVRDFRKTLKDEKEEWWGTEQEIWGDLAKQFVKWYNNRGKKELERRRAAKEAQK